MKFIDKKISDSYFQIYIILNIKEKKEILKKIQKELIQIKKESLQKQIDIYENISKVSNSDVSKDKLYNLKEQLKEIKKEKITFDNTEIESLICQELLKDIYNHIETLGLIQVFDNEFSIIGSFDDNNNITLIYSFCYLDKNYELIYPKKKGNAYFFTNKDTDMIQTELLIYNKMYEKVKAEKVSEFSDLLFSYVIEDDMRFNEYMDISAIESKLLIDRSELIDLDRNNYLVYNTNNKKVIINIKEIYDKKVYDINDDIVKKINFENTSTVKELRNKINNIFSFIYNIKSNVFSILETMSNLNNFNIDSYVYKHYNKQMCEENKCEYSEQDINEIKTAFITSYIFTQYNINIDEYLYYIEHEYNLLYKIKNMDDNLTLEEYFNLRAPYYALYEFFKSKNLVTERSNNE